MRKQLRARKSWRDTAGSRWLIDLRDATGNRVRKFFPTKDEAEAWADAFSTKAANEGISAALNVSDADRVIAARAAELLRPFHGATLLDAARHYADYLAKLSKTESVREAVDALLLAKESDGVSDRYLSDLRWRLNRFAGVFAQRGMATVATSEIDEWLRNLQGADGSKLGPQSRINFRRSLFTLWQSGIARGVARENPITLASKPKVTRGDPVILTPAQMRQLLASCDTSALPGLAIAAFAGLRSAEINRLQWRDVDTESAHIKVSASKAKTASRRLVPISDNLRLWLATCNFDGEDHVTPPRFWKLVKAGAKKAGIDPWPQNALRHSYASYRLAHVANAAQVALECGNSAEILQRHYKELTTPTQAREWFAIAPDSGEKIIALKTG